MGSWAVEGTVLSLTDQNGNNEMPFNFQSDQLAIYFESMNTTVRFVRLN
jgi:hypothetical protein